MSGLRAPGQRSGCVSSAVLALALLSSGLAQARSDAPSWVVKGTGARAYAEVASRMPGSTLRIACEETVTLYVYPPRGWDGGKINDVVLTIDGEPAPVVADAVDRGVMLSDAPGGAVGITEALRRKMKKGRSLVISGPPTRHITPARLTFALEDAARALSTFEQRCRVGRHSAKVP